MRIDVADDIRATVNMKGRDMPWDQVLDLILWAKGLRADRSRAIIRVVPGR